MLTGNYSLEKSTEEDTDSEVANAPQHQIYARVDWKITSQIKMSSQANWIAGRERDDEDSRPSIDDYTTVDLTIRYQPEKYHWEFALSAHNLFDADAREPSPRLFPNNLPVIAGTALTPNDLPLAERNFFIEASYRFDQ
jgi:iron complex outermembrane receptor protein